MARRDEDPAASLGCLIGSLVVGLIVIEALVRALSYLLILGAILLTLGAIGLSFPGGQQQPDGQRHPRRMPLCFQWAEVQSVQKPRGAWQQSPLPDNFSKAC